jgi:plastocyanin
LLEAFRINVGDTIKFTWDEDYDIFNVSILAGIDQPKYWFGFPGNFI